MGPREIFNYVQLCRIFGILKIFPFGPKWGPLANFVILQFSPSWNVGRGNGDVCRLDGWRESFWRAAGLWWDGWRNLLSARPSASRGLRALASPGRRGIGSLWIRGVGILNSGNPQFQVRGLGMPKRWIRGFGMPKRWIRGLGMPKRWIRGFGIPKRWIQDSGCRNVGSRIRDAAETVDPIQRKRIPNFWLPRIPGS